MVVRFIIFCLAIYPPLASAVTIEEYDRPAFNPSNGEQFEIPIIPEASGALVVVITTADGDEVKRLETTVPDIAVGERIIVKWDGRDANNTVVPDEAYIPVLIMDGTVSNPAEYSGGEVIESIKPDFSSKGVISFRLEEPSRILIRTGIQGGPLMRTLANWEPRAPGKNIVRWDGYDKDGIVNLMEEPDLGVLLTGFRLPAQSIITLGSDEDYSKWRAAHGWRDEMPDPESVVLQRNGERLSRHFFLPRIAEREPELLLRVNNETVNDQSVSVDGPFTITVDLDSTDQWAMDQSQYEVAFFINGEFVAEEEQGYVPLKWRWNPTGLKPGKHTLTVNVSSFNGAVGVRTFEFTTLGDR
ncbi:hypothetical protein [Marinobacter changyiensis]|uniref:hypothetical protein n=1 Tax=Marinobacter changyiensis TaxID=2604091 RepID=UPI00126433AB|nr:hypothetical protein [Marinobacter changyiensis]